MNETLTELAIKPCTNEVRTQTGINALGGPFVVVSDCGKCVSCLARQSLDSLQRKAT